MLSLYGNPADAGSLTVSYLITKIIAIVMGAVYTYIYVITCPNYELQGGIVG